MWQAEADTELTLSAVPATAVGQILLTMANLLEYGNVTTPPQNDRFNIFNGKRSLSSCLLR